MKAKVIALKLRTGKPVPTTVNETPVAVGDIVTVDENTFRNLAAKGVLEAVAEEQPEPEPEAEAEAVAVKPSKKKK